MSTEHMARSINPATKELFHEQPFLVWKDIERKIAIADRAYRNWSSLRIQERITFCNRLKDILLEHADVYAETITKEMGKLRQESVAEVEKCASLCGYYADHAGSQLCEEHIKTEAAESYVTFEPLGVILAVMPWNFPFWQVFRCAIPAIMAGNVVVLKHASNVPLCSESIESLFEKAGFPEGVMSDLPVDIKDIEAIVRDERVRGAALTGSGKAGSSLARLCGKYLKPTVLELGGSDPFVVCKDADISSAVSAALQSRYMNAGQSCIAAKRFLVDTSVHEQFVNRLETEINNLTMGDPMIPATTLAPLAREEVQNRVINQVKETTRQGAVPICKAQQIDEQDGYFYPPTILDEVGPEMLPFKEEIFGPVASVCPFEDESTAVSLANATAFGLGSSVWTQDKNRADYFIRHIEAGSVFVNDFVKSDPRLPFGGIKGSGYGRELSGFGIREFVNIKTVWRH